MGCPKCGLYAEDAQRVIDNQEARSDPDSSEMSSATMSSTLNVVVNARSTRNDNLLNDFEWMKRVTLEMARQYGYELRVTRGRASGWHRPGRIHYGLRSLRDTRENGYREYISCAGLWSDYSEIVREGGHVRCPDLRGREALWGTVVHEFAHAIAEKKGYRKDGSVHNAGWASAVRELQIMFPYNEVKDL